MLRDKDSAKRFFLCLKMKKRTTEYKHVKMKITPKYFKDKVGREPEDDDLERSNCKDAGKTCIYVFL